MVLPVIELGKWNGTIQGRRFKSGGLETLGAGGFLHGGEIAGVMSGDYHDGWREGVTVRLWFLYAE